MLMLGRGGAVDFLGAESGRFFRVAYHRGLLKVTGTAPCARPSRALGRGPPPPRPRCGGPQPASGQPAQTPATRARQGNGEGGESKGPEPHECDPRAWRRVHEAFPRTGEGWRRDGRQATSRLPARAAGRELPPQSGHRSAYDTKRTQKGGGGAGRPGRSLKHPRRLTGQCRRS